MNYFGKKITARSLKYGKSKITPESNFAPDCIELNICKSKQLSNVKNTFAKLSMTIKSTAKKNDQFG